MTVTAVHFGATSVPFTVVNATTITAQAPAGLTGAQNVRVTTPHGQSSISASFTYPAPPAAPTITNLNPNNGPAAGGTSVVITGTNFTGATQVRFGATNATSFTVNSATQITATSPAGSGSQNVTVTTPDGTSAGVAFTYAAALTAPVITSANSVNATEGTAFSYTITASGNPAPTFNATGLPAWLTRAGAVVSGTPPAGSGNSIATFTITATNSEGSPSMVVNVNIAEPAAGWTLSLSWASGTAFTDANRVPLTSFVGWNAAEMQQYFSDDLYDVATQADLPFQVYAKYAGSGPMSTWTQLLFDNWNINPSAGNTIRGWGYYAPTNSVYFIGNNATGQPIQLEIRKS